VVKERLAETVTNPPGLVFSRVPPIVAGEAGARGLDAGVQPNSRRPPTSGELNRYRHCGDVPFDSCIELRANPPAHPVCPIVPGW
jgi:hypothetical protein